MTFSCPNYDDEKKKCARLHTLCVPGREGCVLEGKATFADDIETRIQRAEELAAGGRRRRRPGK
jgi:hypothetical protein